MSHPIQIEKPENFSGFPHDITKFVLSVKRRNLIVEKVPMGGDQPKVFIRIYERGTVKRLKIY
jgi:hypothetical protein